MTRLRDIRDIARVALYLLLSMVVIAFGMNVISDYVPDISPWIPIAIVALGLAVLIPLELTRERAPAVPAATLPLRPVTVGNLLARLGRGGQVPYVPRQVTSAELLRSHPAVVITGPMKLGKTREAINLIRRAIADDLVTESGLLEPRPALGLLPTGVLRSSALSQLDPNAPALLFVDDLPFHFTGDALDRLGELLDSLHACKRCLFVATARQDQLDASEPCRTWLKRHAVHTVTMPPLDASQVGTLIDNAAPVFGIDVQPEGRTDLVAGSNGTPEQIVAGLRGLEEGTRILDSESAERIIAASPARQWQEFRDYISRLPGGHPLLDALATFHAAHVDFYSQPVLSCAIHLWRAPDPWRRPWRTGQLRRATLRTLEPYGIVDQGGLIRIPEVAVEGLVDPAVARRQLETFLVNHRRLLHRPHLHRLYRNSGPHMWALFDLAAAADESEDYAAAIRLYTAALRARPDPRHYNNRGNTRRHAGDTLGALTDYDQAIEIDPLHAGAYLNRAVARTAIGDHAGAIADCTEAIRLFTSDAAKARAYNNRGMAHAAARDFQSALADYAESIRLSAEDSDKAVGYGNRGLTHSSAGDYEAALVCYAEAMRLDPTNGLVVYNTACVHALRHKPTKACAWLEKAIALDPQCREHARTDPDLDPIRADPSFQALIADPPAADPLDPPGDTP